MKHASTTILCLALLSACSSNTVKDTLGIDRSPPDEFRVVSRPPLSVPPEFNLMPPSNTAIPPGQPPADKQAQSLLTGQSPAGDATQTVAAPVQPVSGAHVIPAIKVAPENHAESAFLNRAGAPAADPHIRDSLVEEHLAVQDQQEDCSWWDVFCSSTPPSKEPVVNAKGEANRIQQNSDAGKPVTEGATPDLKPKDNGVLGKIFGY